MTAIEHLQAAVTAVDDKLSSLADLLIALRVRVDDFTNQLETHTGEDAAVDAAASDLEAKLAAIEAEINPPVPPVQ